MDEEAIRNSGKAVAWLYLASPKGIPAEHYLQRFLSESGSPFDEAELVVLWDAYNGVLNEQAQVAKIEAAISLGEVFHGSLAE